MTVRVVVVDDHPITRAGTIAILRRDDDVRVVGEAEDGPQALALCARARPDLVLLDLRLPTMSGIEVTRHLREMEDAPCVLMLSAYSDAALVRAALDAGAAGYVVKSAAGADLLAAMRQVLSGERVLLGVDETRDRKRAPLSAQERMVLGYVAAGLTSKEIAARIGSPARPMSQRTVETYLRRLYHKLDVRNRAEAVLCARREGLLDGGDRVSG